MTISCDVEYKLLYKMLKAQICYYKYLYYFHSRQDISDYECDMLEKQFDAIAKKLKRPRSWVGYKEK